MIEFAGDDRSPVHDPHINDCPAPAVVLKAFLHALQADARAIVQADPADFNLGTVRGRIVAFDLGLSCLGNPLTDLALRTGASTMPFPRDADVRALVDRYVQRLGLYTGAPFDLSLLAGAVYGSYFEQGAVDQIGAGRASDKILNWGCQTIQRYVYFSSSLLVGPDPLLHD